MSQLFYSITFLFVFSCNASGSKSTKRQSNPQKSNDSVVNNPISTIGKIQMPEGYKRVQDEQNSFTHFLRKIKLKKDKVVYLYNGEPKKNQLAQEAVLDISVPNKDLQQCADAVMRLRAEYLFENQRFQEIVFWDNEKKIYQFSAPFTRANFDQYLLRIFGMCGSASLSMQLKSKLNFDSIMPGDVLIKGGFPGHAVIVVDVAENEKRERIFMLAQSYMPAQDIHLLKNYFNELSSPWYHVKEIGSFVFTPEWTFTNKQLKTW